MKLSISTKAFIAIQTLSVLAVLSMGFAAYWSFTRSFVGFLNEQAIIRMTNAIPTLEDAYGRSEKDFPNLVKYADPASRVFP